MVLQINNPNLYQVGTLNFDANTNLPINESNYNNWAMFYDLGNGNGTATIHGIDSLNNLFNSGLTPNIHVTIKLTSDDIGVYNASNFIWAVGIIPITATGVLDVPSFNVNFDNLSFQIQYAAQNFTDIQLQYYNGTQYNPVPNWTFNTTTPYQNNSLIVGFQIGNSNYSKANILFTSQLYFNRMDYNQSYASYYIDNTYLNTTNRVIWNVTYNDLNSANQFNNNSLINFDPTNLFYNITIIDLPAFDSLGSSSLDWHFLKTFSPQSLQYANILKTNGTSGSNLSQNITIINAYFYSAARMD